MLALLNLRVILCLALVAGLAFTHFVAFRKGKANVRAEWTLSVAQANEDARRLESARQSRVDEAARASAARTARILVDRDRAVGELDGLRSDLDATKHYAAQSRAAAERAANVAAGLLGECSRALVEMAENAARADSEARALRQSWPK